MRSKAAIGDHPIHPALVPIPIGAFVLALIGDIMHSYNGELFWYQFALYCVGIGILTALIAAIFGFVDFVAVPMSTAARRLATMHLSLNLVAVVLYAVTFFLRLNNAAYQTDRWTIAMVLEVVPLVMLAVSGWIGGQMAYVHRVGVVEEPREPDISTRRAA
ncbi:MAG: DUF2231 domain-containing protein [Acidobacteria bacterium]|nr:DUF2231 domain-containing protein [Acidobacteriota bacterium]